MSASSPFVTTLTPKPTSTAEDIIRAAQGHRVVGLTDFPGETPAGRQLAGKRDFWTPFQHARDHGYIVIDLGRSGDALRDIWRTWTTLHGLPFVAAFRYPRFSTYHVELDPPRGMQWSPAVAVLAGKAIYRHGVINDCWYVGATRVWLSDLDETTALAVVAEFAIISRDARCAIPKASWQEPDRSNVHPITGTITNPAKTMPRENSAPNRATVDTILAIKPLAS